MFEVWQKVRQEGMTMSVKIKNNEIYAIVFREKKDGIKSMLYGAKNPLTNDFVETHRIGNKSSSYVVTIAAFSRLFNKILETHGGECRVKIVPFSLLELGKMDEFFNEEKK